MTVEIKDAKRAYGDSETELLKVLVDIVNALVTQLQVLVVKMDADTGGGGETDYEALVTTANEDIATINPI
jgi:hypothetical protein